VTAAGAHCTDDRLFDLAHELLPASERHESTAHLARCSACEERFRALVADRERARATPLEPAPRRSRAVAVVSTTLAVAACVAFVLLLLPEPDRPQYWMPRETDVSGPRSAPGAAAHVAAFDAYDAHDADRSVELFEVDPPQERYARFVYASALLNAGRAADARRELDALRVASLPEPARRRARWMLYLAHRALGEDGAAEELLATLVDEPGDVGELARAERGARGGPR
jgi:hypothetical protein